jgi:F-type H+-transporting ATPase subunit gamma
MPSLKDVRSKITGVSKTKQITKAMYMVASAKLRGSQARIERFRPYAEKFHDVLGHVAAHTGDISHPLLEAHAVRKKTSIVLITSDRGLCGSLNVSLIAKALDVARARESGGEEVEFVCVGKKGRAAIAKLGYTIVNPPQDEMAGFAYSLAQRIGGGVTSAYREARTDAVVLVYPEFRSVSLQTPRVVPLLPIGVQDGASGAQDGASGDARADVAKSAEPGPEFLYEPAVGDLLARLLPTYVDAQIYRALLDMSASENAARMLAMDNATRNCDELISTLTLLYNKTRQASITSELIDIVGGVEAL